MVLPLALVVLQARFRKGNHTTSAGKVLFPFLQVFWLPFCLFAGKYGDTRKRPVTDSSPDHKSRFLTRLLLLQEVRDADASCSSLMSEKALQQGDVALCAALLTVWSEPLYKSSIDRLLNWREQWSSGDPQAAASVPVKKYVV